MKTKVPQVECHIGVKQNSVIDPILEANGFSHGLISFAIPSLGILFKCRVDGNSLELEFAAFFSLLKFITNNLNDKNNKISSIKVFSSNPEFVFSFTGHSRQMLPGSAREKMLKEYSGKIKIAINYIEPHKNKTLVSPADYPSLPEGQEPILKQDPDDARKQEFRPFQRGIKL